MDILFSILSFVVAIGLLITVHEFGHFWVARKAGVRVLRFSVGFGQPLWRKKIYGGETELVLAAIPLGGYVKMLDEREGEVSSADLKYAFNRKPLSSRMAIVAAGPIFNLLFAVLLYWAMYIIGVSGLRPVIGEVHPDTIAAQAGMTAGDEIVSVNGREIRIWDTLIPLLLDAGIEKERLIVDLLDKNNGLRQVSLDFTQINSILDKTDLLESIGLEPWSPTLPALIRDVVAAGAAEKAGLKSGDLVVQANGKTIDDWSGFVDEIKTHPGQQMDVVIERNGQQLNINLIPESIIDGEQTQGRIGAYVDVPDNLYNEMIEMVRYPVLEAFPMALKKTWIMSSLTLRTFGQMLMGQASLKNISGPITIARYAGKSADRGLSSFLSFLAIISLSLGILNLLPIPVLDGGHLLYNLIEMVKGSPVSDSIQAWGQQLGISLLLLLMGLAVYNDLQRLF
ncbi:MAG: RIP metalloprotease RseP [Gammaproteobacteria bacterium]|nr:RIP metalloprotease RseP [Gammaproteobacteria bacterium]